MTDRQLARFVGGRIGSNSILWLRFTVTTTQTLAALVSQTFWLHFCLVGGGADLSCIFI